jgi:hypothetical protein
MVRRQRIKRKKERKIHSNWSGSRRKESKRKERKKYTQEKDKKQIKKKKDRDTAGGQKAKKDT